MHMMSASKLLSSVRTALDRDFHLFCKHERENKLGAQEKNMAVTHKCICTPQPKLPR
jgi:hypothetical protein